MKTRNSHGLLQLGREALAYCQWASALISGNKALFVSVDLIGEKNQVILELTINHNKVIVATRRCRCIRSPPPPPGLNDRYKRNFSFIFRFFLWIYIQIFPIAIPCPPQSTKSTLAPSRPKTNERFTPLIIPAQTILSLFQLDTQMFLFFNALAKWSKTFLQMLCVRFL